MGEVILEFWFYRVLPVIFVLGIIGYLYFSFLWKRAVNKIANGEFKIVNEEVEEED